jgi:hypothetical protein
MIIINDPVVGTKQYDYKAEAKFDDFRKVIKSVAPDSKLELVGQVRSNPKGASDYKYTKHGDWKMEKGWAYVLSVEGRVVKIGMTDSSLASRFSSYQAGTLKARTKGTCSVTNYYVSAAFRALLDRFPEPEIEIWGYKVPHAEVELNVLGEIQIVRQKMAHVYEARLLNLYKEHYGHYPCLSNNSSQK